jgi:hypothetical protein
MSTLVIPGWSEGPDPESMVPHECLEEWIPGLRLPAHPGMTVGVVKWTPDQQRTANALRSVRGT